MALPTTYSWLISPEALVAGVGAIPISGMRISGRGKVGMAVPFSSDGRGRAALVSGETQLRKLIFLNLMDLESANPFQGDIGIGSGMIFALNNESLQAELRRKINSLFRRLQLEDRARLNRATKFTVLPETQELEADIEYLNLEENKPREVSLRFSAARSGEAAPSLLTAMSEG
jgi:hypothetical protein